MQATAINNKGQIAGYGKLHGQMRAFLLTPQQAEHKKAQGTVPGAFLCVRDTAKSPGVVFRGSLMAGEDVV